MAANYADMTNTQLAQSKWKEALELYQNALEIFMKTLKEHPDGVAHLCNNSAFALTKLNRLEEAMIIVQIALKFYKLALVSSCLIKLTFTSQKILIYEIPVRQQACFNLLTKSGTHVEPLHND